MYAVAVNLKQEIPVQNVPPLILALMKVQGWATIRWRTCFHDCVSATAVGTGDLHRCFSTEDMKSSPNSIFSSLNNKRWSNGHASSVISLHNSAITTYVYNYSCEENRQATKIAAAEAGAGASGRAGSRRTAEPDP